jgi:hypothetical protein
MSPFEHHDLFTLAPDATPYRRLTGDHVGGGTFEGRAVLKVGLSALTLLARHAFHDISHLLRPSHLAQLRAILDDPGLGLHSDPTDLQWAGWEEHRTRGRSRLRIDNGGAGNRPRLRSTWLEE